MQKAQKPLKLPHAATVTAIPKHKGHLDIIVGRKRRTISGQRVSQPTALQKQGKMARVGRIDQIDQDRSERS